MRQVLKTVRNVTQLDSLTNSAVHIPLGARKEATEEGGVGEGGPRIPQASANKKKRSKECALVILAGDIENEQSFLLLHELASACVATRVKALIVSICICVCTCVCMHIYQMLLHELAANARVVTCVKALIVSTRTCVCTFIARCDVYYML